MAHVARAAGVSVMTVSRVLRGVGGYGEAVQARVRAAAERLGYRPDPLVGALMAARRRNRDPGFYGVLAVVNTLPRSIFESNARVQALWTGAVRQAEKTGYRLNEFRCPPETEALARLLRTLQARGVPGILWMHFQEPGFRLEVDLSGFACATYGYSLEEPRLHRAANFHLESMQQALDEVLRRGGQHPGYVTLEQAEMRVHRQWLAAWLEYQRQAPGVKWCPALVLDAHDLLQGREKFLQWFEKQRPDVVIASFPDVRRWLQETGVQVPQATGYVSLDVAADEPATGMDQQWDEIGAAAVDFIVGQLARNERGVPRTPKLTLLPGKWKEGSTLLSATAHPSAHRNRF